MRISFLLIAERSHGPALEDCVNAICSYITNAYDCRKTHGFFFSRQCHAKRFNDYNGRGINDTWSIPLALWPNTSAVFHCSCIIYKSMVLICDLWSVSMSSLVCIRTPTSFGQFILCLSIVWILAKHFTILNGGFLRFVCCCCCCFWINLHKIRKCERTNIRKWHGPINLDI